MYSITAEDSREIHDLYASAEEAIKFVETIDIENGLPTNLVNELRYAGRHIVNAMICDDPISGKKNVEEAKLHIKRAHSDSNEIALIFMLKMTLKYIDDFKEDNITDILPDYIQIIKRTKAAQKTLAEYNREKFFTDKTYKKNVEDTLKTLWETYQTMDIARPLIIKKLEKEERNLKIIIITGIITGIGVIAAIIPLFYLK
jgi:hypothetical protein